MARKITGEGTERQETILSQLDERNRNTSKTARQINGGVLEDELGDDDYGELKASISRNYGDNN